MKKLTTEEFIFKARKIHSNKYDYSKVEYINNSTKIVIVCPEHGKYKQRPQNHVDRKQGCPTCGGTKKLDVESFVVKAREIHGDKYDYSKVKYINNKKKVVILCLEHSKFKQTPHDHLTGYGCPLCGGTNKLDIEEFVIKAKEVHGLKYDYSKVRYINNRTKVIIVCSEHGEFSQTPSHHLNRCGCPSCKASKGEKFIWLYLEEHNVKHHPQFKFKNSEIARNSFDYATERGLIEYHGGQHYFPCSFGSKKKNADMQIFVDVLRRDLIKERWCEKSKIPLFVIPYWDYYRISDILDDYLANRIPVISEPPDIVKKYEPMRNKILERFKEEE